MVKKNKFNHFSDLRIEKGKCWFSLYSKQVDDKLMERLYRLCPHTFIIFVDIYITIEDGLT